MIARHPGLFLVLQSSFLDCPFLDFLPVPDDGFVTPEVNVGWGSPAEVVHLGK
jgi:hypothetical protein